MPPYVAHVPTATIAVAFGASRSSHSLVVIGWLVAGSLPKPDQYPSSCRFSLGIDPSTTRYEWFQLAAVGLEEPLEEVVGAARGSAFEVDQRPVHGDLRQTG